MIDFDITLKASEGPVRFGDTKEGTMGLRVPTPLDARQLTGTRGEIVNSEGIKDGKAWGKAAPWVDYHGVLDGDPVGITIMNHPSSFRYPTYWHVHNYGLFAANPFGLHDFHGSKDENEGTYTLPQGNRSPCATGSCSTVGMKKTPAWPTFFRLILKSRGRRRFFFARRRIWRALPLHAGSRWSATFLLHPCEFAVPMRPMNSSAIR